MNLLTPRRTRPRIRIIDIGFAACITALLLFLVAIPYTGAVASAIVIVPTAPVPSTDVALSVDVVSGPVQADDLVTYTITTNNLGTLEATNVTVQVDLPGGTKKPAVTVMSVGTTQGTCTPPDGRLKLQCDLGTLFEGDGSDLTIVVLVTDRAKGDLKTSSRVDASERDPDRKNNQVRSVTSVE